MQVEVMTDVDGMAVGGGRENGCSAHDATLQAANGAKLTKSQPWAPQNWDYQQALGVLTPEVQAQVRTHVEGRLHGHITVLQNLYRFVQYSELANKAHQHMVKTLSGVKVAIPPVVSARLKLKSYLRACDDATLNGYAAKFGVATLPTQEEYLEAIVEAMLTV